jgi:UDP-N-acetylmuramoyl-tripeptide--D-alanyl-D-alanine ligase
MKIEKLHQLFLKFNVVSTDTRSISNGALFFALKGDNFNGNDFAKKALDSGASYCIIDEQQSQSNARFILVPDVLITLQELANFHRKYLNIPIIAITGSNGKTTTKELINSVLGQRYKTHATQGNYNNHIGVPLTLLQMDTSVDIGIVEMGANHIGEIANLCQISAPNYGYITNFGKAHLEGFGSAEGVVKGKCELYDYLKSNEGVVFINGDDKKQVQQIGDYKSVNIFSKDNRSNIQVSMTSQTPFISFESQGCTMESQLVGIYNFSNAAAAIAMGCFFEVSLENIKKGIASYTPNNNRSQIIQKGSNTIILDAYNANPSSMEVALDNFNSMISPLKIVILGDMFELGVHSKSEHQAVIDEVNSLNFSSAYYVGSHFFELASDSSKANFFKTTESFRNQLQSLVFKDALILIKGSRGMALESILDSL